MFLPITAAMLWTLGTGCTRVESAAPALPPPPTVTVAPVQTQELVEWSEFTGRTEAVEFVEVRPRVSGHIQEVKFQSGQMVQEGDVLFVIDPRWHQADYEQRLAEVEQAKVRLENAEREASRTEQLLANRAIAREEAEAREARYAEAKAALLAAEAALSRAQLDLQYTEVRAPISGRVSRELVTAGNYVSGLAGGATLLTTIVSVDSVYVYADVDENSLLRFRRLMRDNKVTTNGEGKIPVELQLGDEEEFLHHGYLESLDNRLDPRSGSIVLRAVFPNPDGAIIPGLFARIRVPASERYPALLIDEEAIGTDQARKFVLTLNSTNGVEYRPVELGPSFNGKRIVRAGLQPGEKVVVNAVMQRVRPGMVVNPELATTNDPRALASH